MLKYRPEIDGLRAVAVLPVILFHGGFSLFSGGYVGVDVFFVISGYLITSIILNEQKAGTFTITDFYERRARRILPALFFVILCSVPFAWAWMMPAQLDSFLKSLAAIPLFISNIFFWSEDGYFSEVNELKPLFHTWSLAVEEQFYVVFPLFVLGAWRFGIKAIAAVSALTLLVSLALCEIGSIRAPGATYYLIPTRAWELLIGVMIAIYHFEGKSITDKRLQEAGGWFGLGLILYAVFFFTPETRFPSLVALAPTVGTGLIILCARETTSLGRVLAFEPVKLIGLISYSAYLWHQPLFAFARIRNYGEMPLWLGAVLSLVTLGLAYLSWRYVEAPFRKRGSFDQDRIFGMALAGSAAILVIGFVGARYEGFPSRLPTSATALLELEKSFHEERLRAVHEGNCHIGKRLERGSAKLSKHRKNWDCAGTGNWEGVVVLGDSIAGDKAIGFRQMGLTIGQATADSCPITPQSGTGRCGFMFRAVEKLHSEGRLRGLVLSARLSSDEERNPADLARTMKWAAGFDVPVLFIASMPERALPPTTELALAAKFSGNGSLDHAFQAAQGLSVSTYNADESLSALRTAAASYDRIKVVNATDYYCALFDVGSPCVMVRDGAFLTSDGKHLTPTAAGLFMAQVMKGAEWAWFENALQN